MSGLTKLLWIGLGIAAVGLLFWFYKRAARKREEKGHRLRLFVQDNFTILLEANHSFRERLESASGYFSNYQLANWKSRYAELFAELADQPFETAHIPDEQQQEVQSFQFFFEKGEALRADFNKNFLRAEMDSYREFFNNIEGRSLDDQQRAAIILDEDNNLVVAGAGSGKTTTIVGKVNYLRHRYHVSPSDFLLISFTNKSAATLAARIGIEGIEVKTFHKFGKDLIAQTEGRQPSIFDENQFQPLLTRLFNEFSQDNGFLLKLTEYFTDLQKPFKSQFEFENRGDYIQYIKDQDFRTYKRREMATLQRTTYNREVVKSIEECRIANFLLFNGINYEYEFPYEFETANESFSQYKPDFTVEQDGKRVYIEHIGISRDREVPEFFAKEGETREQAKKRYLEKMNWARELHQSKGTRLVETFSYEMVEGTLFENLTRNLAAYGIVLKPKPPSEVLKIIRDVAEQEINDFITLVSTFIKLKKSNNYTFEQLRERNRQQSHQPTKRRNSAIIDLAQPFFERYQEYLASRGEIDFDDMINKAGGLIASGKWSRQIKYIIIDEFQDISLGRYQLVKALKEANPGCKLFCVGDDWQSIYRFSGSDITLLNQFEKYFGVTVRSKIEKTYRFHEPLIGLSSDFILKNPGQMRKLLRSRQAGSRTTYQIQYSNSDNQDDSDALKEIFDTLIHSCENLEDKSIYILSRYGFDFQRIRNRSGVFRIDIKEESVLYQKVLSNGQYGKVHARFMTVHKSKGLEADIVIVLNCNAGRYGFPSEVSDDPVLDLLLSDAEKFENAEERRLFYVAMTRGREQVFFIAERFYRSKFIAELDGAQLESSGTKCPLCKRGDVVKRKQGVSRKGDVYSFFGCSNFQYGCEYNSTVWAGKKK